MRARNLKPSLFKNELLAVSDPLYTVIFQGLWCLADREGRLEDRPAKIHFDINPGRAFETTEKSLAWLAENGFIQRYEADGIRCIWVIQFSKHQNPHQKEGPSKLPKPGASPVLAPDKPESSPVVARLIPSSLIPDSPSLIPLPPVESAGAVPAPRAKPPRAKPRSQIPEGRWLTDNDRAFATERCPDMNVDATFDDFQNHHIAKGTLGADWHAAWRTWVGNCAKGFAYVRRSRRDVEASEPILTPQQWREQQAKARAATG